MITAIAYDGYVEAKIVSTDYIEFEQDLRQLRKVIDSVDRKYVSHKKVWRITSPEKYTRVPFVQNALLDKKKQLALFKETAS